jgi:ankyrin repeat protein
VNRNNNIAHRLKGLIATALFVVPALASAQFSDSYNFLKAVREQDGGKVTELIGKPGSTIVNTRDSSTGETALHIVVARRDTSWMAFLLSKGAKPDLADSRGNTPLLLATQLRFTEGVQLLLTAGAQVDKPNGSGETALIRAVQLRDVATIRVLIAKGANPEKHDTLAGMSARDYAERDGRNPAIMDALNAAKPQPAAKSPVQGPVF